MRILMVSWEYPPYMVGGMGKHVVQLLPALSALSNSTAPIHIDLLTTRYAGGEPVERIAPNVTVHRVELPPIDPRDLYNSVIANNAALIAYAYGLASHQPYDLIHLHDWLVGEAGIALKHAWKIPLLATIHATERGRHQGYLPSHTSHQIDQMEWRICFEAWRLIVCSQFMRGEVYYYFGAPYDKVDVIPNGLDTNELSACPATELAALRQRYAPNGEKLLFFVGRVVHELAGRLVGPPGSVAQAFAHRFPRRCGGRIGLCRWLHPHAAAGRDLEFAVRLVDREAAARVAQPVAVVDAVHRLGQHLAAKVLHLLRRAVERPQVGQVVRQFHRRVVAVVRHMLDFEQGAADRGGRRHRGL